MSGTHQRVALCLFESWYHFFSSSLSVIVRFALIWSAPEMGKTCEIGNPRAAYELAVQRDASRVSDEERIFKLDVLGGTG